MGVQGRRVGGGVSASMPRKPEGETPMTSAERQAKRRDQFRKMRTALTAVVDSASGNGSRMTVSKAALDAAIDALER